MEHLDTIYYFLNYFELNSNIFKQDIAGMVALKEVHGANYGSKLVNLILDNPLIKHASRMHLRFSIILLLLKFDYDTLIRGFSLSCRLT